MKSTGGREPGGRRFRARLPVALGLVIVALLASLAGTGTAAATASGPATVTVLLLPPGSDLSGLDDSEWARGLLSAGMGPATPAQTMLDIGQGTRVPELAYEKPLPDLDSVSVARFLDLAGRRAESAPRPIVVGALRSALDRGGAGIELPRDRLARIAFSSPEDSSRHRPARSDGSQLTVTMATLPELDSWRERLRPADTLIAMELPGGAATLDLAVAGTGFTGVLSSPTTHLAPLVSSVDLAPTILTRLGLPVPGSIEGTPLAGGRQLAFGTIRQADSRLKEIRDRRGDLLLFGALVLASFFLVSGLVFKREGLRFASVQSAVGLPLAVLLLLVMTRLRLGSAVELPLVFALASALAWVLRRRLGDLTAYATACGLVLLVVAVDLVFGLDLIPYSALGSNPIGGVRFFGVGNELEAILACLLTLGLAAWGEARPGIDRRRLAGLYVALGILTMLVLVPGRFGADVGALVTVSAGVAAACLMLLGRSRKLIAALILLPLLLIGVFALIDTVTGGSSHFSRTVLGAGSFGEAAEVLLSRLRKAAHTVTAASYRPYLALVIVAVGGLALATRRMGSPLRDTRLAVGLGAGAVALVFGAAGNDSGVLLILAGSPFLLSFWAMGLTLEAPGSEPVAAPETPPDPD